MKPKQATILKLIDYDDSDCRRMTIVDMLKNAIEDLESDPDTNDYNKAVVLYLNDCNQYKISYSAAGLQRHEIISLLEAMKLRFLRGLIGDAVA